MILSGKNWITPAVELMQLFTPLDFIFFLCKGKTLNRIVKVSVQLTLCTVTGYIVANILSNSFILSGQPSTKINLPLSFISLIFKLMKKALP